MAADELDTLRAEAVPVETAEAENTPPADLMPPVDPALSQTMAMVVAGLSVPICRKAHVTGLEPHESDMLGAAIAQLVTVYDVGPKDPKGAAWMGFGLCCVSVVASRSKLPYPNGRDGGETAGEAAIRAEMPPAPVFGATDATSLGVVNTPMDTLQCG